MWRDSVEQVLTSKNNISRARFAPSGLLRAIAQAHERKQDSASIARAWMWLMNNQAMSTRELFSHLCEAYPSKMCIEKSPENTRRVDRMVKILRLFPDAKFIHLTRSVVGSSKSLKEFLEHKSSKNRKALENPLVKDNYSLFWYQIHMNILKFRSIVEPRNFLSVRGESILSDPHTVLPQICEWLGVSACKSSIDEMMHPEKSPYSFFGPRLAPCGNDPKFITNPEFRLMRKKDHSLDSVRSYLESGGRSSFTRHFIANSKDELTTARLTKWNNDILERLLDMESQLGYG